MNLIERNRGNNIRYEDQIFVSSYATINQNESTDFPEFQPAQGLKRPLIKPHHMKEFNSSPKVSLRIHFKLNFVRTICFVKFGQRDLLFYK